MDLKELQGKIKNWNQNKFPTAPSYLSIIKIMEEVGELAGHYIGRIEYRPGKPIEDHQAGIEDSVADIVIALTVFCHREGIDLSDMVDKVWPEVSSRQWVIDEGRF